MKIFSGAEDRKMNWRDSLSAIWLALKSNTSTVYLGIVLVFIGLVVFKSLFFPMYPVDYSDYTETAELFLGKNDAALLPNRILKPLNPGLAALLYPVFGTIEKAFIFQSYFFYFASALVSFLLFKEFFKNKFSAIIAAGMFSLSYPILKYGLALGNETGALFFYCLSLYLTLLFLKKPLKKLFYLNLAAIALGCLWKEYGFVNFALFNFVLLFHPGLFKKERWQLLFIFNSVFISINALWQYVVYTKYHYTYLDWYHGGGEDLFLGGYKKIYLIFKSLFVILFLGWSFVIPGLSKLKELAKEEKIFFYAALTFPFMFLIYGPASSRLFYVAAPAFIILFILGLNKVIKKDTSKILILGIIILFNFIWLYLSDSRLYSLAQ